MSNEIKKILDITETADYKRLSVDEIIVIKDYIINLQEKNKQTKLLKELYKLRNEKAISMFNNENLNKYYYGMSYEFEIDDFKENMLNILQGSDKKC